MTRIGSASPERMCPHLLGLRGGPPAADFQRSVGLFQFPHPPMQPPNGVAHLLGNAGPLVSGRQRREIGVAGVGEGGLRAEPAERLKIPLDGAVVAPPAALEHEDRYAGKRQAGGQRGGAQRPSPPPDHPPSHARHSPADRISANRASKLSIFEPFMASDCRRRLQHVGLMRSQGSWRPQVVPRLTRRRRSRLLQSREGCALALPHDLVLRVEGPGLAEVGFRSLVLPELCQRTSH